MFERTKPCKTCPFRISDDAVRYLGYERAEEIVDCLRGDGTFTCHDDLDLPRHKRNHCVGAMILLEAEDRPNQMMRISERLGDYDKSKLSGHEECFDDFDNWIDVQGEIPV